MIDIELFQYEPSSGIHRLKIWINGHLSYVNEICNPNELCELRDGLQNELQWMNDYLREQELD